MSKLLKFIVNLFLIGAILVAVAILVPPLAGVTTTIVDTAAMNTNLPLGSITYSTDINVYDIKPGDEILKENDSSTYAYVIRETDPANGKFIAVSAADENGSEEEIILRNTVSKVAVVIPFIGYIIMAMHSVEGIVIIVLVVVLMIIMFILSELWKHSPEDDEEEDGAKQDEEEPAQVSASEETGIDTAAIKEAVEENHTAVLNEDAVSADEVPVEKVPAEGISAEEVPAEGIPVEEFPADDISAEAVAAGAVAAGVVSAGAASDTEAESDIPGEDNLSAEADSFVQLHQEGDAVKEVLPNNMDDLENDLEIPINSLSDTTEKSETLASLATEMEERARENGTDAPKELDPNSSIYRVSSAFDQHEDADEKELAAAEAEFFGISPEEKAAADKPAQEYVEEERFAPVSRPMLEEIMDQARESGKEPPVRKDDRSGISIVDVSDLL